MKEVLIYRFEVAYIDELTSSRIVSRSCCFVRDFFCVCAHSHLVKHVNISLVQGRGVLNWLMTCVVSKSCAITHLITYSYTLGICFGGNDLQEGPFVTFAIGKGI